MIAYMLKDPVTNLYYRRVTHFGNPWVEKDQAAVWLTTAGPTAAKSMVARDCYRYRPPRVRPEPEIVEFDLIERTN